MHTNAKDGWSLPRVLAMIVAGMGVVLLFMSIVDGDWSAGRAPYPFVWRDVAIVHLFCALPLAWLISHAIHRAAPSLFAACLTLACLAVCACIYSDEVRFAIFGDGLTRTGSAVFVRVAAAICVALSVTLVGRAIVASPAHTPSLRRACLTFGMAVTLLVLAPLIYVNSRSKHDANKLDEYLEQGRIGEAAELANALLALDPEANWREESLRKVAADLTNEVARLEKLAAVPLPANALAMLRLQRARILAILGRTDESLQTLATFDDATHAADAECLRGTIHETRDEWTAALAAFQQARTGLEKLPSSPARAALLERAITGIAFAQRKAGDYVGAAATYQSLLELSPAPKTHFLLAQFYEDAQDAEKARSHARHAMTHNPARYQAEGDKLIRKLRVFQFGCLRALRD